MHTKYVIQMAVSMEECFNFSSLSVFSHILNALGYDIWRWDLREILDFELKRYSSSCSLKPTDITFRRKPI